MAILPTQPNLSPPPTTASTGVKLMLGQIYQINITQIKGNQVQFNLGSQTFTAQTKTPLTEKGMLSAKVLQTNPNVQLGIAPPQSNNPQIQATLQGLSRQLLPNQTSINQAIQLLSNPKLLQQLPPNLQAQIQVLINQLFKPNNQLTGEQLKNQIQNSGLFLENTLLKKQSPSPKDLKAKFLQLQKETQSISQNKTSHAHLAATLNKALNKITLQQIQLFENPNNLSLEMPIAPNQTFKNIQLHIRKKATHSSPKQYEAILNLTLTEGQTSTKIILNEKEEISLYLWADTQNLINKMENLRPELHTLFKNAQISLKQILFSKQPPQPSQNTQQISLIDIKI